jgi:protein arginine kinase activator
MICDKCGKNTAGVKMQQFINGVKSELNLCQECVFKFDSPEMKSMLEGIMKSVMEQVGNMQLPPGFGLNALPVQAQPQATPPQQRKCDKCGMTAEQFKAGGKMGCEACYAAFGREVHALLKTVQASRRHEGKFPRRMGVAIRTRHREDELRTALKAAIADENFEEAARLRDEIRELAEVTT